MIQYIVEKELLPSRHGPKTQHLVITLYPTLCAGWFYSVGPLGTVDKIDQVFSSVNVYDAIDVLCKQKEWKMIGKVHSIDDSGSLI